MLISSLFILQGMWIGMFCGVAMQSLVLFYLTWRTNWDEQVDQRRFMKLKSKDFQNKNINFAFCLNDIDHI